MVRIPWMHGTDNTRLDLAWNIMRARFTSQHQYLKESRDPSVNPLESYELFFAADIPYGDTPSRSRGFDGASRASSGCIDHHYHRHHCRLQRLDVTAKHVRQEPAVKFISYLLWINTH